MTPETSLLIAPPVLHTPARSVHRIVLGATLAVALVAASITALTWKETTRTEAEQTAVLFDVRCNDVQRILEGHLSQTVTLLRTTRGLLGERDPSTEDWRRFAREVRQETMALGVESLGFLRVVSDDAAPAFETERRRDPATPDFKIRYPGQDGSKRGEHIVLTALEPDTRFFGILLGTDVGVDPLRGDALQQARDLNQPMATGRLGLLGEAASIQADMVVYLPLYRSALPISNVEERRAAVRGYLSAAFRFDRLMGSVRSEIERDGGTEALRGLAFTIRDVTDPNQTKVVYASGGGSERAAQTTPSSLIRQSMLEIAGRKWRLDFFAMPTLLESRSSTRPTMISLATAALGLAVTLLTFAIGMMWENRRNLAQTNLLLLDREEELRRLAVSDPLTGLANRRQFHELGTAELSRTRRHGRALSLLMVDVDHFKAINDRYGHAVGDETLKLMAAVCKTLLRDCDLFARLGGEEFAAILPETDLAAALMVAERLRMGVAQLVVPTNSQAFSFTISVGVAQAYPEDHTLHELVHRADQALYAAKAAGRNRVISKQPETAAI